VFLYIDPLKQGLKHPVNFFAIVGRKCFYT